MINNFLLRVVELTVTPKSPYDGVAHRKTGEDQKQKSEAKAGAGNTRPVVDSIR